MGRADRQADRDSSVDLLNAISGTADNGAQPATNEARRLMLLHNVDAAATVASGGFSFPPVGATKARSDASARILADSYPMQRAVLSPAV